MKGAPTVHVTPPTAFNVGRFCFAHLGYIYDKILGVLKYCFYKLYHKGYSICSHSFSYGFQDKTFLVLQFDCRYMQDVYSMTLRNYINFFFNFRTKIVTNVHNVVQMSKIVNGERNPNKIVDQLRSSFLKQRNPSTVASICQARTNPQMKFDTRMLPCFRSRFNYMYFLVATAIGVLKIINS